MTLSPTHDAHAADQLRVDVDLRLDLAAVPLLERLHRLGSLRFGELGAPRCTRASTTPSCSRLRASNCSRICGSRSSRPLFNEHAHQVAAVRVEPLARGDRE